jgi:hypothetical protein
LRVENQWKEAYQSFSFFSFFSPFRQSDALSSPLLSLHPISYFAPANSQRVFMIRFNSSFTSLFTSEKISGKSFPRLCEDSALATARGSDDRSERSRLKFIPG